jgi:hypothetical protein
MVSIFSTGARQLPVFNASLALNLDKHLRHAVKTHVKGTGREPTRLLRRAQEEPDGPHP